MRSLVSGGAGFIGSHLCERLLQLGHEVLCVDNLFTGDLRNIEHLRENEQFKFILHDVTEPIDFEVDYIFNLACPASPIHYQSNPVQTLKTNVLGVMNMLELAKVNGSQFLQASTSEIYGDPEINPQPETYWGNTNPIGVRSCYDEGKRVAETFTYDYFRQYNLNVRVARIFNTYGPRMATNDGRVVSNFIVQALNQEPLTIYGDGTQIRSFCYVDDLIDGMIRLQFNYQGNEPINIGNPAPINMIALATEIVRLTGSSSVVTYQPLPKDDPRLREPDIERAKMLLGWEPTIDLGSGLERTIQYFRILLNR
jgi:UDP-glucuronate decarboxylase